MGWNLLPVSSPNQIANWLVWKEIDDAIAERVEAVTGGMFPRSAHVWWTGTVTNATETSIQDSDSEIDWTILPFGCSGQKFYGYSCEDFDHIPQFYDIILSKENPLCLTGRNPRLVIRARITGNTSNVISFESIATNKDVFKQISSYGELNGSTYWVIPRGFFGVGIGLWWHERVFPFPSGELWRGSVTESEAGIISHDSKDWGNLSGKDIVYFFEGNYKRASISSNTDSSITLNNEDVVTGEFHIVPSGGIFVPSLGGHYQRWYGGVNEAYRSLAPDLNLFGVRHPVTSVTWSQGPEDCEDVSHDALSKDLWSEYDEQCSQADKCYSPLFFWAIHGRQAFLEEFCSQFIPNPPYPDPQINNMTRALAFKNAGINFTTTIAVSSSGSVTFSFSVPSSVTEVFFTILDPDGNILENGVTSGGSYSTTVATPSLDGKTITLVASWGWTRKIERQVRYIYSREWFEPSETEDGLEDPPNEDAPGTWYNEEPSSFSQEYDDMGFPTFGVEIVSGQRLRYVGSNWHDSDIAGISTTSALNDAYLHYAKYAEFQLPLDIDDYEQLKVGSVVEATTRQLKTNKNFWNGVMRTESGTATAGSTTSLSDVTKISSAFWQASTGRWLGFVIEIQIGDIVYKRPITSFSGTTIGWTEPLPESCNGKSYWIREPSNVRNRWKGRMLYVTIGNEEQEPIEITHSDSDTLFFNDCGFEISEGDGWRIDEITPGEVIQRIGTNQYQRVNDSKKTVGDILTRYGKARKNDYVGATLINELYQFVNSLRRTRQNVTWRSREFDEIAENNLGFQQIFGGPCYNQCEDCEFCNEDCSPAIDLFSSWWGVDDPVDGYWGYSESDNAPPYASISCSFASCSVGAPTLLQGSRRYSYAEVTVPGCVARTVDIYIFVGLGIGEGTYTPGQTEGAPCTPFSSAPRTYDFNLHNDSDIGGWHDWVLLGSQGLAAGDSTTQRIRVGSDIDTQFNYPDCPPLPDLTCPCEYSEMSGFSVANSGWITNDSAAIVHWHFNYQTEEE